MVSGNSQGGAGKESYYDRTPISRTISYGASNIAPHAAVVRATFTVPTAKKLKVMSAYCSIMRKTVATTVGKASNEVYTAGEPIVPQVHLINTIGNQEHDAVGEASVLLAAQTVEIDTADASIGGTIDYWSALIMLEFDV